METDATDIREWIEQNYRDFDGIARKLGTGKLSSEVLEDIAQAAAARLLAATGRGEVVGKPRAFLYATIGFLIKDHFRKSRRFAVAVESMRNRRPVDPAAYDWDKLSLVVRAIDRLPKKQAEAIRLFYIEGRRLSEIADVLDTNTVHAKKLVSRARSNIRKHLGLR